VFAPSAGIRAKVIREPALPRRGGWETALKHSDTDLDEEAVRNALRDELGFDPSRSGRLPYPSELAVWIGHHCSRACQVPGRRLAVSLRRQAQGDRVHP
jgi:hypothetical protein